MSEPYRPLTNEERAVLIAKLQKKYEITKDPEVGRILHRLKLIHERAISRGNEPLRPRSTARRPEEMSDTPPTRERLLQVFKEAASPLSHDTKDQMGARHMLALAELFESWVFDRRLTPIQTTKLLGWAERFRRLAEEVGPDWDPPPPAQLSVLGYLGRVALDEDV
jgi:hypothetical protein